MRIQIVLVCCLISINLVGCQHYAGNVVPQIGVTMEQAYDSMGVNHDNLTVTPEENLPQIRASITEKISHSDTISSNKNEFQKLPNPALRLYVYPHLAGNSEIPIPGYYTTVSAYDRDHYGLPNE